MHNAMQPVQTSDRNKPRTERLRQIELEQQQWEQEALVMPAAWDQLLLATFESVKIEFSNLDGLSWSQYRDPLVADPGTYGEATPLPMCNEHGESSAVPGCTCRCDSPSQIYTVPPRSQLASFGSGGTIRAPQHSTSLCSANQFNDLSSAPPSANISRVHNYRHTSPSGHSQDSSASMGVTSAPPYLH